ncbi:hypothetical protein FQA39_LY06823 [Lamprigera yunnana]|nr:hypothetical protein FQA39_LY06823 [Lamprigera yunnana]
MKYLTRFAMDNYYGRDRVQEIWQQIGELHLSYLEMEESTKKLEQRNKLDDYVHKFLCLAPHNQKFIFPETADVLHRSASAKKDFSGYKAATAWNAIGMYAANLVSQPWRKEYKQIKLYSGFYKHQIDSNLVGAEVIFEVMGYKHDGDSILTIDGPICPDRVISVSQDALIAYMECQILKAIWEEVSTNFEVTWLEVLEFREAHLCSPMQSIQSLNYLLQERQYRQHIRSYSQGTDSFTTAPRYSSSTHNSSPLSTNHSFPTLHSHTSIASLPLVPQCIYGANGYYPNNIATYAPVVAQQYQYHVPSFTYAQTLKPTYHPANCFPNGCTVPPPPPAYVCSTIPTAQLVEVDVPSHHLYDTVDGSNHPRISKSHILEPCKSKQNHFEKEDTQSDNMDNWDYVYRSLESKGYCKDLGERGDVLTQSIDTRKPKSTTKDSKRTNSVLEEALSNLCVNEKLSKSNEAPQKYSKERSYLNSDMSKSDDTEKHMDTESSSKKPVRQHLNEIGKSNTLSTHNKVLSSSNKVLSSKTLDVRKQKQMQDSEWLKAKDKCQNVKDSSSNNLKRWHCTFCTYLNDPLREICEMCCKSKNKVQDNLVSGGSECSNCTLVNPKNNKQCDACQFSLANSPTYI